MCYIYFLPHQTVADCAFITAFKPISLTANNHKLIWGLVWADSRKKWQQTMF